MAVTQKTSTNLSVDQGATFAKNLTVTTNGTTAYDISALTLRAQMRTSYASSTLTAEFTTALVTATSGIYSLTLSDTQTKAISSGRYVYDVMLTLADSTVEVVHSGIVTVNPRATKA